MAHLRRDPSRGGSCSILAARCTLILIKESNEGNAEEARKKEAFPCPATRLIHDPASVVGEC